MPLHLAPREGHVVVAQVLVEHDADAAAQDKDKDSVATGVFVWSRGSRLAFHVKRGAYVPARDNRGRWTSLGCSWGSTAAARQDREGRSLLHEASMYGQVDCARFLLMGHGAEATTQDKYRQTLLHEASSYHRTVMWVSPGSSWKSTALTHQTNFKNRALCFIDTVRWPSKGHHKDENCAPLSRNSQCILSPIPSIGEDSPPKSGQPRNPIVHQ